MTSRLLYIILFSVIALKNTAQKIDEKDFTLCSLNDGLSSRQVNAIAQDTYGYLWIATKKGLNRFDGNSFQHFYADNTSNSLPQDEVAKLRWIDKEQLAAITNTGLHIVNTRNIKQRNLIIPPGDLKYVFKVNYVSDLASDEAGNIFILTRSGFYQFNNKDKLVFRYDAYKKEQVETESFAFGNSMAKTGKEAFLLSTAIGICIYDTALKELKLANKTNNAFFRQVVNEGQLRFLQSDDSSFTLFIGITKELVRYDIRSKKRFSIPLPFIANENFDWRSKFFKLNDTLFAINGKKKGFYLINYKPLTGTYHFKPDLYFENYFCSSVFSDNKDILWIGTNKGLFRQNKSSALIEKTTIPISAISGKEDLKITEIVIAGEKIFAGTNGDGLFVFDRKTMKLLKRIDLSSYWISSNTIRNLLAVNNDTIFIGTAGPLIWINTRNYSTGKIFLPGWQLNNYWVSSQFKDSKNNIYVCNSECNSVYVRPANTKNFIQKNYSERLFQIITPTYITEDQQGNIWFAGHGLSRYNFQQKKFDLLLDSFPRLHVPRQEVTSAQFDKKGSMYFGLVQNGLITYDLAEKKYQTITRDNGLPDNTIVALILLGNKLWIGTESGLASYDLLTKTISSFGIDDGIPGDEFTARSFFYDTANRQLYGAFNNTIVRFNPTGLLKNNSPPQFFIENISVNGKGIFYHPDELISLSYKQNNLVMNLGAVNFTDAYLQRFSYRLVKNGDESWQETGFQRNIIFSNLAPGNYLLQIKVFSKSNTWPEQTKEINIIINPPFWQTAWFIIAACLLVAGIIYYLDHRRIKQVKQKANLDRLVAQTEMKALHSQMNPHFIFNCLNSIREMILNNENDQASLYLSKFARLIRITLNHSSKTFVTLEDTIDYLQRYLEMEQIRKSNFAYTINVEDDLQRNEILLPPMLIQPFLENAIWHGAATDKEMHLTIKFQRKQDELICIVEDDGIGIETSLKTKEPDLTYQSLGIANIRQRIQVLNEKYNLQSTVEIKDKSNLNLLNGTGTIVTLHLAIKPNESLL